jgi:ketosteroid isomerase-like protein
LLLVADSMAAEDVRATDDDVIATDREFAALASETGLRNAFDRYLADDAVLFRPLPVPGREWLLSHEPASGRLEWAPAAARVSCDGSLAITTGSWAYTPPDSKLAETGQYLTAWRRSGEGDWRIVLDQAVALDPATVAAGSPAVPAACDGRAVKSRQLESAEKKVNAALRSLGVVALNAAPGSIQGVTTGTITGSAGGDLALTHGEIVDRKARDDGTGEPVVRAVYVRVWQRTGSRWGLLLDVVTPMTQ